MAIRPLRFLLPSLLCGCGLLAQEAPRSVAPPLPSAREEAIVTPPEGPRSDNALARERAWLERRGGRPSEEYLLGKNRILEAEALKWKDRAPLRLPVGVAPPALPGGTWVNLGPGSLDSGAYSPSPFDLNSGRPTAIVTHPTNPQILYLASSGGGVWKCSNADPAAAGDWTWVPITDTIPASGVNGNVPIGHLAMDPSDPNTLYAGLGDKRGAGYASGFWITHDGGSTWTKGWINAPGPGIATTQILPLGGNVVLVSSYPGLYRSTNGGATFLAVGPTVSGFYVHGVVAFSATELALAGVATDISGHLVPKWMYSADGGATWTDSTLDSTLTSLPLEPWHAGLAGGQAGDGVAYATVGIKATGMIAKGVARTADKGHSWTFRASSQAFAQSGDGGQPGYNMFVAMDPANSNNVFIGANLGSYRSLDGGLTWTPMTNWVGNKAVYAHADWQAGAWSKTGPKTLYVCNDGGLAVVRDPLRATMPSGPGAVPSDRTFIDNTRNKGLANHLLYSIASTTATNVAGAQNLLLVGMQDNSTAMRVAAGSTFLLSPATGDGMGVLIHSTDATRAVASSYGTVLFSCTDFGATSPVWHVPSGIPSNSGVFYTQVRSVPTDLNGVITATRTSVFKSTDFGQTFTPLGSSGLSGTLRRIAASYLHSSTYAVTAILQIGGYDVYSGFITQNGGGSWTQFGTIAPFSTPWDIDFSPSDPNVLYTVDQQFSFSDPHVFKSTNLGVSWAALDTPSNGFPFGIPANVIRESRTRPNTLYVGTDIGVYASEDGGANWARLGTGQPYVRVDDLYEAPDGSFLRTATYGRGVWEIAFTGGAPVLVQPASIPAGTAWAAFSQAFTATGGTPPYTFSLSSGSLPAGMTLSAAGLLSGTPTATGSFPITVRATDSATPMPGAGSRSYTLTVQPPVIALGPNPLPAARATIPYNQTVTASGGMAPYTLALTSGGLPPGLAFTGTTGVLAGTPTVLGSWTFTLQATDAHGFSGTLVSNLAVLAPSISLAPGSLPGGQKGEAYSATLTASGGTAPYTFTISAGNLPPGFTLGSGGALTGVPTAAGSFGFTVQAKDANNYTGSAAFTIVVLGPPLVLGPTALADGTAFQTYSVGFTASGGVAPYRFNLTSGNLPPGVSLEYTSGMLSGTPTAVGSYPFTIRATDAVSSLGSLNCVLRILAPTITLQPASLSPVSLGAAVLIDFSATGGQPPYTFAVGAGALPPGTALSASGRFSGTAGTPGNFAFSIIASDRNGFTGSQAYTLAVGDQPPEITSPPVGRSVRVGESASFTVTATGTPPLAYQWKRNGVVLPGATAALLTLAATAPADDGAAFNVTVSNNAGNATSPAATLRVGPVAVSTTVAQAGLLPGRTASYSATVAGSLDGSVTWSASGGTLTPSGGTTTFQAATAGSYILTATAVADPSRKAQINVLVHGADYTTVGRVTGVDALKLIGRLGVQDPAIDLNGDGLVDAADLDLLLSLLGW